MADTTRGRLSTQVPSEDTAVVVALDGIGLVATVGFFVPAAIVVLILAVIIIRDRRSPVDDDEASNTR